MGQIVSAAAKPKRCNLQSLSSLGTPAAGEYILVSSDNSMNAAGHGNFDCYIVGTGNKLATELEIKRVNEDVDSVVDEKISLRLGGIHPSLNSPKVINMAGGAGTSLPNPQGVAGWGYYEAPCSQGAKLTVSGNGGNYGLWGFVDENNIILSWSGKNVRGNDLVVIAPENVAKVIVNTYNPGSYTAPVVSNADSVQVKIDETNDRIDDISDELSLAFTQKTVSPTFTTGKYINSSGNIATAAVYEYGTFAVEKGDIIRVHFEGSTSAATAVVALPTLRTTVFLPKVISANGITDYTYICEEDGTIVVSGITETLSISVIHSRIDEQLKDAGLPYGIKRIYPEFTFTSGQYWTKSGTKANLAGYQRSSGVFLKKGTYISIYWPGVTNNYISILTEVDSEDGFIRACVTTPSPNVEGEIKHVIDKDGFYALSNNSACVERYVIVEFANGDLFFNPPLDSLFLQAQEQDEMPREILRTSSFVGIVHKWGFIGDSLSSGEQAVHEDGTSTLVRFDKYDYSWGQRLCALNGVEGYNFSVGGQTTKGWCTGSGDRTWAGAQLQENWKEAYCIALGVNDRSSLSPGDADTDINLSDYTQNADTFAGWYASIIQRLRSVNPKCRIFCLTIPYNNQQGYLDNNEVIRAIVPKFSKCYLVDLANYHWTPSGLALNDHLSPAGYQWAAWEINTLLDWVIRKNLSDFEDIAFVGTNYSK